MKNKYGIMLNIVGVIAICTAVFIWVWLGTVGLYIMSYSAQMNKEASPYFGLGLGFLIGWFVFKIGRGVLKRKNWARKSLMVFWAISSLVITGNILFGIRNLFMGEYFIFEDWLGEVLFWGSISALGILHLIFLRKDKVKELFMN